MIRYCPFRLRAALSCARHWPCHVKVAPCGGRRLWTPLSSFVSSWRGPPSGPTFSEALAVHSAKTEADPSARHYTYAVRGRRTGLWYIGSRKCPDTVSSPEADTQYMGSPTDSQFKQERKDKIVLTKHSRHVDALQAECFLHEFYNVAENSEFANQARQTSTSFSRQGTRHTEETKQKMSQATRGRPKSEETKQRMSEAKRGDKHPFFGKHHTEEAKQRMSEAKRGDKHPFFGKRHTEEAKQRISEALRGRPHSEETKQRMSEAKRGDKHPFFGKHHTEEAKQRMSEAKRGDKHPFFGKRHTEEAKQRISEATHRD
ncbi:unnamed protein product [Prorocentrum cordatum]|uniref:Nuclease associated modular domain-containing protein n=1 Tax=Prorocentrum cordatum TaxID=2364126 RepID=A0ABN9QBZ7_9DINO|nr:unnamed protein product [Polarella glacialis]